MILRIRFDQVDSVIPARFHPQKTTVICADFGEIQRIGAGDDLPVYDGTYNVIPATAEQTLPTAQKKMLSDVKIEKIPYAEVSNNSGGITATIGNEV